MHLSAFLFANSAISVLKFGTIGNESSLNAEGAETAENWKMQDEAHQSNAFRYDSTAVGVEYLAIAASRAFLPISSRSDLRS